MNDGCDAADDGWVTRAGRVISAALSIDSSGVVCRGETIHKSWRGAFFVACVLLKGGK